MNTMTDQPKNRYLEGVNVAPRTKAQAEALIGHRVKVLLNRDIDRSGRGYIFPHVHTLMGVYRRHLSFDDRHNYLHTFSEVVEMQDLGIDPEFEPVA
jgi:hypothetical protein